MKTADLELTISVTYDSKVEPCLDAIRELLLQHFPWVSGVVAEAVTVYEEVK